MQADQDKYFSVKYHGISNPLVITLPPNERGSGAQYLEVELGSFFWTTTTQSTTKQLPVVKAAIPGLSSGNYDVNGLNTNLAVIIAPGQRISWQAGVGATRHTDIYTYSPGRPDLYLCPPSPQLVIYFYNENDQLIDFNALQEPYYCSLNIST